MRVEELIEKLQGIDPSLVVCVNKHYYDNEWVQQLDRVELNVLCGCYTDECKKHTAGPHVLIG